MITLEQWKQANNVGRTTAADSLAVTAAVYNARRGRVVVTLRNGVELAFDPGHIQGLAAATAADLRAIEVSPMGTGLHFPRLDADVSVSGLLAGAMGSERWMAAQLGAAGGASRSRRKKAAARANGKLGGRPRKAAV